MNLVDIQADTNVMDSFHTRVIQKQLISMAARTFPNIDLSLHPSQSKHRMSAYSVYHIANSAHGFDFPFRCFLRYFTIWVLITLIERSSELSPQWYWDKTYVLVPYIYHHLFHVLFSYILWQRLMGLLITIKIWNCNKEMDMIYNGLLSRLSPNGFFYSITHSCYFLVGSLELPLSICCQSFDWTHSLLWHILFLKWNSRTSTHVTDLIL